MKEVNNPYILSIDDIIDQFEKPLRNSFLIVALGIGFLVYKYWDPISLFTGILGLVMILVCLLPSFLYVNRKAFGLPIVPAVCLVEIMGFGLPVIGDFASLANITEAQIVKAVFSQFLYLLTMIFIWKRLCGERKTTGGNTLWIFEVETKHIKSLNYLWLAALGCCALYVLLLESGWIYLLLYLVPWGAFSVMRTAVLIVAYLTIFALSFSLGQSRLSLFQKIFFSLFYISFLAGVMADIYLNPLVPILLSSTAGYLLGSGKLPWRYLLVFVLLMNVLHQGKHEMRLRYWEIFLGTPVENTPMQLPGYYAEWFSYGLEVMTNDIPVVVVQEEEENSIFARASIIQMLIYAQDRAPSSVPYLMGRTIYIVPALLIPRIFWPDKPRTHEGQVLLNVHFGRQSEESAQNTYISWGLLSEFYANFGQIGCVLLGVFLGNFFGRVSRLTINSPLTSFRLLMGVVVFIGSFAATQISLAVFITSLFQSSIIVVLFSFFLMKKVTRKDLDQQMNAERERLVSNSKGLRHAIFSKSRAIS